MLAFGVENSIEGIKNDERYIKWIARQKIVSVDAKTKWLYFPVHNCTQNDFSKFYQPSKSSEKQF